MTSKRKAATFCGMALLVLAAPAAFAADWPVTGAVTLNGHAAELPAGTQFVGSSYDQASGAIASGQFVVPPGTTSFDTGFGTAVVSYQLTQTNTSSGQVGSDGAAALTTATFTFAITSMTLNGSAVNLGSCVYGPFDADLGGMASSTVLSLEDTSVTVQPVSGSTACGGPTFQSIFNQYLAGTGSVQMEISGNFTPPPDNDLIFANGFDGP